MILPDLEIKYRFAFRPKSFDFLELVKMDDLHKHVTYYLYFEVR